MTIISLLPYVLLVCVCVYTITQSRRTGTWWLDKPLFRASAGNLRPPTELLWIGVAMIFSDQFFRDHLGWLARAALLIAGSILVVIYVVAIRTGSRKRLRDRVRAENGSVCTSCLYSLCGSPKSGICPECGTEYTQESLRSFWQKAGVRLVDGDKPGGSNKT
jgi:hypothetical protein